MLRGQETLPRSFYGLLHENGIDPAQTVLTDVTEDQGCCLAGTLRTCFLARFRESRRRGTGVSGNRAGGHTRGSLAWEADPECLVRIS